VFLGVEAVRGAGAEGRERRGVVLMAYGGPESLADVEPFLLDIRNGRATSREVVEEVRARYAAIGGRSPLGEITRAQAVAVEAALAGDAAADWRVFVGMRHSEPRIAEAVAAAAAEGRRRMVALCLAPHYSRLSIGAYLDRFDHALAATAADLEAVRIESWHDHPGFVAAVAERVVAALARVDDPAAGVLFTAHSLPARIVAEGDPYDRQLRESCELVAGRVEAATGRPLAWSFAYQSAAIGARDWLGPAIEQAIAERAAAGVRELVAVPVGFVSDHVEVLYDLDVEACRVAAEAGVRLTRSESLNTSPAFVAALADLVRDAARAFDES
jgi:protoporphyrin/coproporphyrin ferrochelatase